MSLKEQVDDFITGNGMSQAELARSIGVSPSALSQILKGTYKGDSRRIENLVESFLTNFDTAAHEVKIWIETENTKIGRFVIEKAVSHRKMALIYGYSGYGKTEMCRRICQRMGNGVFIEADAAIMPMALLRRICGHLKLQAKRSMSDTLTVICDALQMRNKVLFLDEAEYCNAKALELMRRINDFTGTPIIFSGTHDLIRRLRKHKQLQSRIRWAWEMKRLTTDEERRYLAEFCSCEDAAIRLIRNHGRGCFRDTEALAMDSLEFSDDGTINADAVRAALEVAFIQ